MHLWCRGSILGSCLFFKIETTLQKRRFSPTGGGGYSVEQFIIRRRVDVSKLCSFQLTT
jgi:hypothetical protein